MSFLEKIYDKSPIFFQNVMTTLSGYIKNFSRYGKEYKDLLEFFEKFDHYTMAEKKQYQTYRLLELINYANKNSTFYKKIYKDIDISTIKTIDDLKKLPIVTKEMLRENINDVITTKKNTVEGHTGGTTGKSLVVQFTKSDNMERMAIWDHFKKRVGFVNRKMRKATFNGKHIVPPKQSKKIFWRYNHASKQMIYSSFHINQENIPYYIKSLNKFKPEAIDGFFTSMCDIANYIKRNNIELKFKPIAIFPTSETLTETGKALLEEVFKCKVYNQYASSEGAPFITECENQKLHIEMATGVFEHFEKDSNEVLVTSFTTHGTPLIRYKIGDSVEFFSNDDYKCECGNESIMVKDIQGRTLDFLYTSDGTKINGGNIANLFKNISNAIICAQLIQNNINEVIIKLEIDKNLYKKEYDTILEEEFKHKFGINTKIDIQHVDKIEREKSGKFKMIINNVNRENI